MRNKTPKLNLNIFKLKHSIAVLLIFFDTSEFTSFLRIKQNTCHKTITIVR